MIQAFSSYTRNIAVFLIFASFVSIITPQKKYKEYINLILSLLLIFIVLSPLKEVLGFLGNGNGELFTETLADYGGLTLGLENGETYEQAQKDIILSQYANELSVHLKRITESSGLFTFMESVFYLDSSDEDFGAIQSVSLTISEKASPSQSEPTKKPLIRIEKVEVDLFGGKKQASNDVETSQIKELKKSISDFYQILPEHIHIICN